MERFIKSVADSLDRRSFFRKLGVAGMGAAAAAGVLMLPGRGYGQGTCSNNGGPCAGAEAGVTTCHGDGICQSTGKKKETCECVRPSGGGGPKKK